MKNEMNHVGDINTLVVSFDDLMIVVAMISILVMVVVLVSLELGSLMMYHNGDTYVYNNFEVWTEPMMVLMMVLMVGTFLMMGYELVEGMDVVNIIVLAQWYWNEYIMVMGSQEVQWYWSEHMMMMGSQEGSPNPGGGSFSGSSGKPPWNPWEGMKSWEGLWEYGKMFSVEWKSYSGKGSCHSFHFKYDPEYRIGESKLHSKYSIDKIAWQNANWALQEQMRYDIKQEELLNEMLGPTLDEVKIEWMKKSWM